MTPRRRNFRRQSRNDDESYQYTRYGEEERRRMRPKSASHYGWAAKGPPASLEDLDDSSFPESPSALRLASGPFAAHRGVISFSHTLQEGLLNPRSGGRCQDSRETSI